MRFMLKHLKTYQLFESFKEDILDFKSNHLILLNNLKQEIKSEVDDYMNYFTDEFYSPNSSIGIDLDNECFEVYYMDVVCDFSDKSLQEFINLLREVENRMKKNLNVRILISTKLFTKKNKDQNFWEELRYGSFLNLDTFTYAIKNVLKDDLYIKIKCDIRVCSI